MTSVPNTRPALTRAELEAHWMPYTGNRQFKDDPRMIVGAEGIYYESVFRSYAKMHIQPSEGLLSLSCLWCQHPAMRRVATYTAGPRSRRDVDLRSCGHVTSLADLRGCAYELRSLDLSRTPGGAADHAARWVSAANAYARQRAGG